MGLLQNATDPMNCLRHELCQKAHELGKPMICAGLHEKTGNSNHENIRFQFMHGCFRAIHDALASNHFGRVAFCNTPFFEYLFFFLPNGNRFVGIPLFEDLSAENKYGVDGPQREENAAGNTGALERTACKFQQKQKRRDHYHSREIGQNV